ncbi:MAG TPA: GntR family transcriptional regulator [Burkholderiales bacterium]|nr:GntR family transcriptional regulator [Burkholderiales bacterium]
MAELIQGRWDPGLTASPQPLYKQVKQQVIQALASGEWKPGQVIPSEHKLAQRFGVAVSTVRAAIGELVAAKILVRKQGKGTFVPLHNNQHAIYKYFHVVRNDGFKELPLSELLSVKQAKADARVAKLLQLPQDAKSRAILRLTNLLTVSRTPIVLSYIQVPTALFPGLSAKMVREVGMTLYAVYQIRYGISIIKTIERVTAAKAEAEDARILCIRKGEPVLEIERLAYTFNGVPVEVRRSRVRTDQYHYLLTQGGEE